MRVYFFNKHECWVISQHSANSDNLCSSWDVRCSLNSWTLCTKHVIWSSAFAFGFIYGPVIVLTSCLQSQFQLGWSREVLLSLMKIIIIISTKILLVCISSTWPFSFQYDNDVVSWSVISSAVKSYFTDRVGSEILNKFALR